jgi:high-affinity nickel permease
VIDLLFSVVVLGFFLGMRHATDADHVIAVGTIVSREASVGSAARIGLFWGLGHSMTILVVGGAIVAFGLVVPARLELGMELSVGVMLIVLGVLTVAGRLRDRGGADAHGAHHSHPHAHGDYVHVHPHGHAAGAHGHREDATPLARLDRRFRRGRVYESLRPFVVGVVHGLAGSAAVALLVAAAIPSLPWAFAYLVVFGLGTVAGMMLVTAATALPFVYAPRAAALQRSLGIAAGTVSLGFGLVLVYRIVPTL